MHVFFNLHPDLSHNFLAKISTYLQQLGCAEPFLVRLRVRVRGEMLK